MQYDSNEEMYMDWWLQELKAKGYIKEIIHQPKEFNLSEGLWRPYYVPYVRPRKDGPDGKMVDEEIIKSHIYTTDIKVIWDDSACDLFAAGIHTNTRKKKGAAFQYILYQLEAITEPKYGLNVGDYTFVSYIEVKPSFDQNNMTRLAKINQKWVYDKFGIYVNIVIPEKHFNKTFTPKKFFFTNKTGKPRKLKYKNVKTLEEFLKI